MVIASSRCIPWFVFNRKTYWEINNCNQFFIANDIAIFMKHVNYTNKYVVADDNHMKPFDWSLIEHDRCNIMHNNYTHVYMYIHIGTYIATCLHYNCSFTYIWYKQTLPVCIYKNVFVCGCVL